MTWRLNRASRLYLEYKRSSRQFVCELEWTQFFDDLEHDLVPVPREVTHTPDELVLG